MARTAGMWPHYVVLFTASACLMALEMAGSRMLALEVGANLYTWTNVIGVVLLGMSLGVLAGGWIADRFGARQALGHVLALAGGLAAVLLVGAYLILDALLPNRMAPLPGIGLPTLLVLGPPSLLLGMASPLVYKLALTDAGRIGYSAGRLGAAGALGSIAGTYAAGFWLIPTLGTQYTVYLIALTLSAMAVLILLRERWESALPSAIIALLLTVPVLAPSLLQSPKCHIESAYYCIRVNYSGLPEERVKTLVLDHLIHSGIYLGKPDVLWYEYERLMAWIIKVHQPPDLRAFFIGGGGYVLPHWIERHYPQSTVEVAEIDPAVTRVALREFVPESKRIVTYSGDARTALQRLPAESRYHLIVGDAFNDITVPYHLVTAEFTRQIRERLLPGGMYMANIIDTPDGAFLSAFTQTMRSVFPYVYAVHDQDSALRNSFPIVVVGSLEPLPWEEWKARDDLPFPIAEARPSDRVPALTDDYSPVDQYLLPVFRERWKRR